MYKNPVFSRKGGVLNALLSLRLVWAFILSLTSVSAWSQDTLTVYDGTATNGYVPIYGFYADSYLKAEFVMSSDVLSDMSGSNINSLTFYASQTNVSWGNANF